MNKTLSQRAILKQNLEKSILEIEKAYKYIVELSGNLSSNAEFALSNTKQEMPENSEKVSFTVDMPAQKDHEAKSGYSGSTIYDDSSSGK